MTPEDCYAAVADELNDEDRTDTHPPGWEPITLEDLDKRTVAKARLFAEENRFPWPPRIGDFDRYYEWSNNGHKYPLD